MISVDCQILIYGFSEVRSGPHSKVFSNMKTLLVYTYLDNQLLDFQFTVTILQRTRTLTLHRLTFLKIRFLSTKIVA
jgi:hypothetical protein